MHAKAIVIDESIVIISTGNYLAPQMAKERSYVVPDEDPSNVPCTRLLVSPVHARQRLFELISSATETLDLESMQLADTDVRAAIQARKQAGVQVRVILADTTWIDTNADAAAFFAQNQIPANTWSRRKST